MFEKLESFTRDVSDLPDRPALNQAAALKEQFDAAPNEVRVYLNKLIDALKLTTSGDSGAKNIGVSTIPGIEGNDIQIILEKLSSRGVFYGKGDSISLNSGFVILPVVSWIKEMNSELYEQTSGSNIKFKKGGLYKVEFSLTRSDLPANQTWEIGYAINDDSSKLSTVKMVMGQYGWNQTSGPNNTKVPLAISDMVRVSANDYINFNNNSQDGPRSYGDIRFNVMRISD